MQFLTLERVSRYCKSYFPTTHITCDYGFSIYKVKEAAPSFSFNRCPDRLNAKKMPVVEPFF